MKKTLLGTLFGALFGFLLSWTTFTRYETIFGALVFEDLYLWFMFTSALITSTIGLKLLRRSGAKTWIGREPIAWTTCSPSRDIVVGSLLFGVGWAIAGTCPGPAAVQVGQGRLSSLFTLAGILAGIVLCDVLDERATSRTSRDEPAG